MDNKGGNQNNNRVGQGGQNRGQGGGFNRNQGFNRGGGGGPRRYETTPSEYFEKVVQVNRVSKKTKGGDKRGLSVLVVVGDKKGKVGVGLGKAADVQSAVRKATTYAKRHMFEIALKDGRTIPHQIQIKLGAAKLLMKPAKEGTGVIAGGPARVVVEAAGIRDIVTKSLGTKNKASNVYAAMEALKRLKRVVTKEVKKESVEKKERVVKEKTVKAKVKKEVK